MPSSSHELEKRVKELESEHRRQHGLVASSTTSISESGAAAVFGGTNGTVGVERQSQLSEVVGGHIKKNRRK